MYPFSMRLWIPSFKTEHFSMGRTAQELGFSVFSLGKLLADLYSSEGSEKRIPPPRLLDRKELPPPPLSWVKGDRSSHIFLENSSYPIGIGLCAPDLALEDWRDGLYPHNLRSNLPCETFYCVRKRENSSLRPYPSTCAQEEPML